MSKYKYILTYENGVKLDSEEEYGDYAPEEAIFNSYSETEEAALYSISCSRTGSEIFHMSNPGHYDYNEDEDITFEIVEKE